MYFVLKLYISLTYKLIINIMSMTIEQAKETFLFDFIKLEMIEKNTTELTKDILNSAYQKTVKFLSNEENLSKLKQATYNLIKNGK